MCFEDCPVIQRSIKLLMIIISGCWAITQTWTKMIFFTIQAVIYIVVNSVNFALQNPYVKLLTEIISLAMYTTQMCQLIGVPMILAYCNFLPLVLITVLFNTISQDYDNKNCLLHRKYKFTKPE
uniref:Uncharacterized protein n=1 Tax=Panstrongylus lignarius TaxID=156445 RepID=A0A224XPC4_9HEMI